MAVIAGDLTSLLPDWLPRQRWFPAKGRQIADIRISCSVPLLEGEPAADIVIAETSFEDGGAPESYQVLVGHRAVLPDRLEHVAIGRIGDKIAYDGLWDHEISGALLDALSSGRSRDGVRFTLEPDAVLPRGLTGRVLGVEQSNTSVVFGESLILKQFRRVVRGSNPDLDLHRALCSAGSRYVARVRAAVEAEVEGDDVVLAILQDFAGNAADGWSMCLVSVRDLYAEGDLRADEVGADFAGEAFRLGECVAAAHADLRRILGSAERDPHELATAMRARLAAAEIVVPDLAVHAPAIRAAYDRLAARSAPIAAQRIHGDLHLGQTLRTPAGWLLTDFEGEPTRSVADRMRPDSVLRDVAGVLRSFDYAAHHQLVEWGDLAQPDSQRAWRAVEWTDRNRSAFCDGYAALSGGDPRDDPALLHAYELDKAVYETVYEIRNRPSWLSIPLASIGRSAPAF